ncbi:MAG TPA: hypothetical protein VLB85_14145, partial [Acidimicrobiia bacterium]|nr:hypothetical protein [Acidimicrobiia bacterium]
MGRGTAIVGLMVVVAACSSAAPSEVTVAPTTSRPPSSIATTSAPSTSAPTTVPEPTTTTSSTTTSSTTSTVPLDPLQGLALEPVATGLAQPTVVVAAPDGESLLIAERTGRVVIVSGKGA